MEFDSLDFESTSDRTRGSARDRHLKMSMKYLTASVNVYDSVFLLPSMPTTCGYLQFSTRRMQHAVMIRETNNERSIYSYTH